MLRDAPKTCPDAILKQRADHALQLFAERIRKSTASKWLVPSTTTEVTPTPGDPRGTPGGLVVGHD